MYVFDRFLLKEIRDAHSLTQSELSSILFISKNAVSDLERGRYQPSFNVLASLLIAFPELSPDDFFMEV